MGLRWVMHVDMDAFYASIEQRDHIQYRGKPVIVGGLFDRGVVATASYEARAFGVYSAMSMKLAKRYCPEGIFIAPRIDYYKRISEQIYQIFQQYSPQVERLSLDEAFLDISGMERKYSQYTDMGREIKQDILNHIGLVASVGIGPNKFIAKIASDIEKPNGLVFVPYGQEQKFLYPLSVKRIWGVGKITAQKLEKLGLSHIGDVANASVAILRQAVGEQAKHLKALAQGVDTRPIVSQRELKSISYEHTYTKDLVTREEVYQKLRILAYEVAGRLRKQGVMGRTITLKIRNHLFYTFTRSLTSKEDGFYDEIELYNISLQLYNKSNIPGSIRLLGLGISHLCVYQRQAVLFSDKTEKLENQEKLNYTLDRLHERFGNKVIIKGFLLDKDINNKKD